MIGNKKEKKLSELYSLPTKDRLKKMREIMIRDRMTAKKIRETEKKIQIKKKPKRSMEIKGGVSDG